MGFQGKSLESKSLLPWENSVKGARRRGFGDDPRVPKVVGGDSTGGTVYAGGVGRMAHFPSDMTAFAGACMRGHGLASSTRHGASQWQGGTARRDAVGIAGHGARRGGSVASWSVPPYLCLGRGPRPALGRPRPVRRQVLPELAESRVPVPLPS